MLNLRYLFVAKLKDGSIIEQPPDDASLIDSTRSAYYDVSQRLDDVIAFALHDDKNYYAVDLRDGHFEINGVPFSAQPVATPTINEGGKFRLLYYRDHQQELIMGMDGSMKPGEHTHQYRMGWEYFDPSGKSYVQTIVVV